MLSYVIRPSFSIIILLIALLIPNILSAQSQWELVWSDEFDYTGIPNPDLWSYDVGGNGWGNQEEQYYTDARSENARVDGDHLIIEARKESWVGRNYTSARLVSKGKGDWTYGRIEVRAQVPKARGTWPAIWMLPTNSFYGNRGWPDTGEIDIMEHLGHTPGRIHATIHTDAFNHLQNTQRGGFIEVADATDALHVYAVEWTPTRMKFSVDGNSNTFWTYNKGVGNWTAWPFDTHFHLILNVAIGGTWGGQQGIDPNLSSEKMLIDYVRVYQYVGVPSITYEFPTNIQVGGNATFTGTSSDPDGRVQRVEFYQGDGLVDRIVRGVEQWTVTVDNLSEGCYNVRAKVIDDGGWTFDSPVTPFNVGATCGQAPYLMSPHPIERRIEAEYFDLGGPRVAYRDLSSTNDGNGIRLDEGVDIYPTTDGTGYHIGNTSRREWVNYTVHVDRAGIYDVQVRMASQARSVSFSLEFDGVDKTGLIEHPTPTNTFRTARINLDDGIQLDEGTQVMKLTIGGGVPSINWFQFRLRSPTNREETPDTGETALMGNYPNPFTSSTIIDYYIATSGHFELDLFNTLGQHVRTLANHHHQAGNYTATVYAQGLSPGTYVYRLSGRVTTHGILQYVRE